MRWIKLTGVLGERIVSWVKSFPASLVIGIVIGGVLVWAFTGWNTFIAGAILGVVLKELYTQIQRARETWKKTHPLRLVLGPIADSEDCYIFFSSFFRDLSRPKEYRLQRYDGRVPATDQTIQGPEFVVGEGDAVSLALIQSLLAQVPVSPDRIIVERGDQGPMKWGVNCFCIGAHNTKTRAILSNFKTRFYYFDNNYTVITKADSPTTKDESTGRMFREGVFIRPCGDTEPIDYGILLKLKDEFQNSPKAVFVVAGIGPAGTSGAAYFLLTHIQELSNESDQFGVLVEVPSGYQSARRVEFDDVCDYYFLPNGGGPFPEVSDGHFGSS